MGKIDRNPRVFKNQMDISFTYTEEWLYENKIESRNWKGKRSDDIPLKQENADFTKYFYYNENHRISKAVTTFKQNNISSKKQINTQRYICDDKGNLKEITSNYGGNITYERDERGFVKEVKFSDGRREFITYNLMGDYVESKLVESNIHLKNIDN